MLFDADGVLLDSFGAHLDIFSDLAEKYGLGLPIPTRAEFRQKIRAGIKLGPMENFFMAFGFSPENAREADEEYRMSFSTTYNVLPFPGVTQMLELLEDFELGIVTSNNHINVSKFLDEYIMNFFGSVQSRDIFGNNKADGIRKALTELGVDAENTIYVGDQSHDRDAALEVGVEFIGVTYGWTICAEDNFPTVNSVEELTSYLINLP